MVNSSYRLTAFCPKMAEAWFLIVEADMAQREITDDSEKFNKVLTALGVENASRLQSDLQAVPTTGKYEYLKTKVIQEFGETQEAKFDKAFSSWSCSTIGDDALPSKVMQRMLDNTSVEFQQSREFKMFFLRELPPEIRPLIASSTEKDLKKFAVQADRAIANFKAQNQAAAIYNVSSSHDVPEFGEQNSLEEKVDFLISHVRRGGFNGRGRGRGGQRGGRQGRGAGGANRRGKPADVCFFHWKFGEAAMNCEPPCKYNGVTGTGNAGGRHGQ